MKDFLKLIRRYVSPYYSYVWGSVFMNVLSAVFNIFSFTMVIPIMNILFSLDTKVYEFIAWGTPGMGFKDILLNNIYWFVSDYMGLHGASKTLLMLCLALALMTFIKTFFYFGSAAVMVPIRTGVVRDLRRDIYNKIVNLPIGFFTQERKGDIIARMSGDVSEVEYSIGSTIDMLVKNPILIVFYVGVLFFISWKLTIFVMVFAPIIIWLMSFIGRKLKAQSIEAQDLWSDTMSQLEETLGGLRVIKAFLAENKMAARFSGILNSYRHKIGRVSIRQAMAHPVSEFIGTVMIAVVLWVGGSLILGDHATIDAPTFIFYMIMLYSVIQPIKDLSRAAYGVPKGLASMARIDKILCAQTTVCESPSPVNIPSFESGISFEHVGFSYDGFRQILDDICLEIPKGKTVAIVGASGAGKSTLVDLVPRFYDACSGSVSIDGVNVKDLKISDMRALMGNVNQEAILFNDTILNNIAFGVENATQEQVEAAARIANAHDFIMEKPLGYQENIGDRGQKLSGGQRQRISIARAILKNPPILILDEATASLDTESERLVQEALDRLMSNRTTIAIAHRLSTIKNADLIVVMDEGKIVERGTHDELVKLNGYYKKLYDMQAL